MKRLLVVMVMVSGFVFAEEYGYFSRLTPNDLWTPQSVTIDEGDAMVIINSDYQQDQTNKWVRVDIVYSNGNTDGVNMRFFDAMREYNDSYRTICGPVDVRGRFQPNSSNFDATTINYKIIRASSSSSSSAEPINIVSLPADNNGDVDLLIETSPDLQAWTPIYSDSIGATGTATFIRTRLVTE